MLKPLKKFYNDQQLHPTFWGIFLNPFYFARKGLWQGIKQLSQKVGGRILDIGCGQKPYKNLFNYIEYIGLEIDSPQNRTYKKADIFYDGKKIPFEANSFDTVLISQVFEHIFTPGEILSEISRISRPNGLLIMTVPFIWDEHEQPFDFARYSSFGIKYLLEQHGFQIVSLQKSINDIRVIFQLINAFLYKKILTKNPYFNLLLTIIFMSPFNILGEILSLITPKNNDLYLDNIVLARNTKNA